MNNPIAFDFDGVICDSYSLWRGHYWDKFGFNMEKEDQKIDYGLDIVKSEYFNDEWWHEIPVAIAKYQHIAPAVHGSLSALKAIHRKYGEICIISAREPSQAVMRVTHEWCRKHFHEFDYDFHFVSSPEDKYEILTDLKVQYYVDDRFATCQKIIDLPHMKASFVFDHPCNRDYGNRENLKPGVYRIQSLCQMKQFLDSQMTNLNYGL